MAQLSLYAFAFFYIGRVQELVTALEPLRVVLILTVLACISAALLPAAHKHQIWREREVRLVLLLGLLAIALMPFSVWPGLTYNFLVGHFARVTILFLLIVAVTTRPQVATGLVMSLLGAITLLSVIAVSGSAVLEGSGRAYASKMYDPNDLAMLIDCALPFAALGAFALRGVGRLAAVVSLVLGVVAVVKTVSRGGFIGLALVGLLLVLRWKSVSLLVRLTVLAGGIAILSLAVPSNYWYSIGTIFNVNPIEADDYLESGYRGRTEVWKQGLVVIMQNWLLGVGAGAFEIAEGMTHDGGKWSASHNSFIQIAAELGVVGFAIFLAMLITSIRNVRAVVRAVKGKTELASLQWIATATEMSLYVYIVVGFALSQGYSSVLYFLFGISTALRLQVHHRERRMTSPVVEPVSTKVRRGAR